MAKAVRKRARGKGKGSAMEREVCKMLSLWWTQEDRHPRDDVFWRTAMSGGRATVRRKQGKTTANSAGDICALDPIGQPLLSLFSFELKRGYSRSTIQDLWDRNYETSQWWKWIQQARESRRQANSKHWALITRRDRAEFLITMTASAAQMSIGHNPSLSPCIRFKKNSVAFCCFTLKDWLDLADPVLLSGRIFC